MKRPASSQPSYRLHKASGQAIVTLSGEDHYLGLYGSKESRKAYDLVVSEWLKRGRAPRPQNVAFTITMLCAAYVEYLTEAYPSQRPVFLHHKSALSVLNARYGNTLVTDFGPLALQVVRDGMIALDWSRLYVNQQVNRLRRMFKWGVSREIVPASVQQSLLSVEGLRCGRSDARETEPVRAVAESHIASVLPFLSRQLQAIVRLQLLTGARPGEICLMRGVDIQTGKDARCFYVPATHKNAHRGQLRQIAIGPKAKAIVDEFSKPELAAYLFSPADAEGERREALTARRKTPLGQGNGPGTNVVRKPKRHPGDHFTSDSYRRAIARACVLAFPFPDQLDDEALAKLESAKLAAYRAQAKAWRAAHHFHPHQIRHTVGTRVREESGLEAASAVLGHASLAATEIYAERSATLNWKIAERQG